MQNVTIAGAAYTDVPAVQLPKTGGGSALFTDTSDTTATAADVKSGKKIYLADGSPALGSLIWNWMGEDAECIDNNVHSISKTLDDTPYASWTPSTTALVLVASENKTARAINTGDYDYYIRWRFTADIAYNAGATMKAAPIRQASEVCQAIIKRPSTLTNLQIPTFTGNGCVTFITAPIMDYYNSSGTHTLTYSASYGFYVSVVAATFSNSTSDTPNLTIKTPSISVKCNSSYFATARGAEVDQKNSVIKLKGELWRMKRGNAVEAMYQNAVDLYNNGI